MKGPVQNALRWLTRVTRPLALRSAGSSGSGTSVVRHVGRRSGRSYQTPVVAVEHDDSFLIALPYGERTDWLKNVLAKGSATLVTDGHTYEVDQPEVIPMAEATACFRPREQRMHRQFRVGEALRVRRKALSRAGRGGDERGQFVAGEGEAEDLAEGGGELLIGEGSAGLDVARAGDRVATTPGGSPCSGWT